MKRKLIGLAIGMAFSGLTQAQESDGCGIAANVVQQIQSQLASVVLLN